MGQRMENSKQMSQLDAGTHSAIAQSALTVSCEIRAIGQTLIVTSGIVRTVPVTFDSCVLVAMRIDKWIMEAAAPGNLIAP